MTKILAWHFLSDDGRLTRYERPDGTYTRRTLVKPGMTFRLPKGVQPKLCKVGFHGSVRALDALGYASGSICCRTEHSGLVVTGYDKLCSSVRKVLWMVDATNLLHEFACWCAEQSLLEERAAGREPDPRSWEAIKAKRLWLRGGITDEELAAARDAAWAAAWAAAAAWDAAWAAARDAARVAARAAAWAAAEAASRAAAEAAAWAAARDAAEAAARAAAEAAAWAAARDAAGGATAAAWAAARDAAGGATAAAWVRAELNTELERRLLELAGKEGEA